MTLETEHRVSLRASAGMTPRPWLAARRIRAHAAILALCLWSVFVWNVSSPGLRDRQGNLKGTDFLHFYALGTLALEHRSVDLYNMNAQAIVIATRVPQAAGIRYLPLYPPQVSLLFAPLAWLPYSWALGIWWSFSAVIYAVCCWRVWRVCPQLREHGATVAIAAAGFPAFFHLIVWGQTSALALACFTAVFLCLRRGREFWTGVAIGCLIFKPQLGLAAAVVFVALGAWRTVAGAILAAAVELGASVVFYGVAPLREWVHNLRHVSEVLSLLEPRPYQTHSLRTFWQMLLPWPAVAFWIYVASAVAVLSIAVVCWRRKAAPLNLRFSVLLLATVLIAPHLTVYDLVIVVPTLLLLANWAAGQTNGRMGLLLYLIYLLPLIGLWSRFTHVQLSVLAMSALVFLVWKPSRPLAESL